MIPVCKAEEPDDFDASVRQPGLRALHEMTGQAFPGQQKKRRGKPFNKIADKFDAIPADKFPPYWRDSLPAMLTAYQRCCAYLALYIEHATGNPSIDHVVPKSKAWNQVYEWDNYRLACALINSKKNNLDLVLDPFTIAPGTFTLEFVAFQVKPGPAADEALKNKVEQSIAVLGLNSDECCKAREEYVTEYKNGGISLAHLERRAPFIAAELRRQGKLLPDGQQTPVP